MTEWTLALASFVMVFASDGIAQSEQSKNALVGTWKLVSVTKTTDKGEIIRNPFGLNPTGFLTYTAGGRMTAIITYEGRKPLSVNDYISAPAEERAEAFATMIAYAGRYMFTGDKVTHHVEAASLQNWVNTDQVRFAKLQGDRLTLRTPPGILMGGVRLGGVELVWEQMK